VAKGIQQEGIGLNDVELRLVSELIKNSRRSSHELAKAISVSQPTVSRRLRKLEEKGVVREYTILPDFRRLGYNLMALTFFKLKPLLPKDTQRAHEQTEQLFHEQSFGIVMYEKGMGLGYGMLAVSFHEDYSSFIKMKQKAFDFSFLDLTGSDSFLIDLNDKVHYKPFSLMAVALDLLNMAKQKGPTTEKSPPT